MGFERTLWDVRLVGFHSCHSMVPLIVYNAAAHAALHSINEDHT